MERWKGRALVYLGGGDVSATAASVIKWATTVRCVGVGTENREHRGWEDCFCPRTYNLRAKGTQITVVAVNGGRDRGQNRTGSGHLSCKLMYCRFYAFMQFLRFRQHDTANARRWVLLVGTGCWDWDCNAANCCCRRLRQSH